MKRAFEYAFAGIVVMMLAVAFFILSVDAYEFERTGACTDCVILDKIRDLDGGGM